MELKRKKGQRGPDKKPRAKNPDQRHGPKSRKELGLPETVLTSVEVEKTVMLTCREKHGTLANALRFAAKSRKKTIAKL